MWKLHFRISAFKNGHREVLVDPTQVLKTVGEPKIVLKRTEFTISAIFGLFFRGTNNPSKSEKSTIPSFENATHSQVARDTGPRGCFLITHIQEYKKRPRGAVAKPVWVWVSSFSKIAKITKKGGQKEPFWPFWPFQGPLLYKNPVF